MAKIKFPVVPPVFKYRALFVGSDSISDDRPSMDVYAVTQLVGISK